MEPDLSRVAVNAKHPVGCCAVEDFDCVVAVGCGYISCCGSWYVCCQELLSVSCCLSGCNRHGCSGCAEESAKDTASHHAVLSIPHHVRAHLWVDTAGEFVD